MTEEIIKSITEAEARAAKIKESAFAQAAEIAAKAEERAFEIEKSSEEVCRAYRETQLKAAEADAEKAKKRKNMPTACSKIQNCP